MDTITYWFVKYISIAIYRKVELFNTPGDSLYMSRDGRPSHDIYIY